MYVYEGHMGSLFTSDYPIPLDDCYCEQCGDYDWEIGDFETAEEFLKYYADNIDCYDGYGGWDIEYVFESVINNFCEDISIDEVIRIVKENRNFDKYEE